MAAEDSIDELKQENELLLLQLHQVQEELEHYYLECKRLKESRPATFAEAPAHTNSSPVVREGSINLIARLNKAPSMEGTGTSLNDIVLNSPQYKALEETLSKTRREIANELGQLQKELEEHKSRGQKLKQEYSELIAAKEKMVREMELLVEQVFHSETQIKEQLDLKDNEIERLQKDLEEQKNLCEQLKEERKELIKTREALAKEHTSLTEQMLQSEKDMLEQLTLKDDELASLRNENLAVIEKHHNEHETALAHLQEEIERHVEDAKKRDANISDMKDDLSVALRLQTMRENDLRDIQARYESLLATKKQQDDLLLKLQQRLRIAAERLKQLASDDGTEESRLTQDLLQALSGNAGH